MKMKTAIDIMKEPDPFLREIWAAGYDEVIKSVCSHEIILVDRHNQKEKRIDRFALNIHNFSIIKSVLIDGTRHDWIKEGDGSADRFRNLIAP